MLFRHLQSVVVLSLLAGCTKPLALPDNIVTASSPGDFARFRADLGTRFPAEQLKDFDTATQELQLDAMHRDIRSSEGREQFMRDVITGKTVHAVTLLGWQARKERFLREIAEIARMIAHDEQQAARTAATGTPETITRRLGSEREVLAKLQANLAATESHLVTLIQSKS